MQTAPTTKLSKLQAHITAGNWGKAFAIASKFHFGIGIDQKRVIDIAAETYSNPSRQAFYEMLGTEITANEVEAKAIILELYGPK